MRFGAAVASGLSNYANFSGRASRSEYWWWGLFASLASIVAGIFAGVVDVASGSGMPGHAIRLLLNLALLVPNCAIAVRRLHDLNRSGWWFGVPAIVAFFMVLMAIPIVIRLAENHAAGADLLQGVPNAAYVVLAMLAAAETSYFVVQFIWFCSHGTPGANRYGPDPLGGV